MNIASCEVNFLQDEALPHRRQGKRLRIVSQSPYLTHALEWLGYDDCVVGVSSEDSFQAVCTGDVLQPVGEAIAALQPDLVVVPQWVDVASLQAAWPANARLLQLDGFRSLADAEAMLYQLAQACGASDAAQRRQQYHQSLAKAAAAVPGKGRRALLLGSCTGPLYSFGRACFISELFELAGFELAETNPQWHNLHEEESPPQKLYDALSALRVEIVFALNDNAARQCQRLFGRDQPPWLALASGKLFHPGPGALPGLADLSERMSAFVAD